MRVFPRPSAFALALSIAAAASASVIAESNAEACGACFAPTGPSTQVTSHRMAFALSLKRTILWDQVKYSGSPAEFGWVLPIRTKVDVGVSSDQFFQNLESLTRPVITAPAPPACPAPTKVCRTTCGYSDGAAAPGTATSAGGGDDAGLSVDVWSDTVVGPYEAVQLSATDPAALKTWLSSHGYVLPADVAPVVDAYVTEGFGFLAIKLVPQVGVESMVPIRIAYDGGQTILPLRMVAGGTGSNVGITLFLLGDGRWDTQTIPGMQVAMSDVTWDWSNMGGASDYFTIESNIIAAQKGNVFISETSERFSKVSFASVPLGPSPEAGITTSTVSDMDELNTAFASADVQVSRLYAELPRTSLANDLQVQASTAGNIPVSRTPGKQKNYYCPTYEEVECPGISPTCGSGGPVYDPANPGGGPVTPSTTGRGGAHGGFGCATSATGEGGGALYVVGVLAGLVALQGARRMKR